MDLHENGSDDGSGLRHAQDGREVEEDGGYYVHQGGVAGEEEDLVCVHRDGQVHQQLHRKAGRNLCERLRYGITDRGCGKSLRQIFTVPISLTFVIKRWKSMKFLSSRFARVPRRDPR